MHWPSTDGAFCSAQQQSPIDLCGALPFESLENDGALTSAKADDWKLTMTNMKTVAKLTLDSTGAAKITPTGGDVTGGADSFTVKAGLIPKKIGRQDAGEAEATWKLAQAHFHWGRHGKRDEGSEHYIEGVQHPLEVHFVHYNSKYDGLTEALGSGKNDALLVVGQFFKVDDLDSATMGAEMTKLSSALSAKDKSVDMAPYGLIDQTEGFYTYAGSLTTPTCNPVVSWIVMKKVSTIPSSTLAHFHDQTANAEGDKATFGNFRNLQAKGDRTVYYSKGEAEHGYEFTSTSCNPHGAREPVFMCKAHSTMNETFTVGYPEGLECDKGKHSDAAIGLGVAFGLCFGALVALIAYISTLKPPQAVKSAHTDVEEEDDMGVA